MKKDAGRKMVRYGAPKGIWDNKLEFEAYRISHITMGTCILQGEVTYTVMLGGNSDTSKLCEHGFYDWVMFRDKTIKYPDKNLVLGRYLGSEIDVGTALTDGIMKETEKLCIIQHAMLLRRTRSSTKTIYH